MCSVLGVLCSSGDVSEPRAQTEAASSTSFCRAVSHLTQVQAFNASEEDVVSISTVLRQAVSVEISLSNPLEEELRFQVVLHVSNGTSARMCRPRSRRVYLSIHRSGAAWTKPFC